MILLEVKNRIVEETLLYRFERQVNDRVYKGGILTLFVCSNFLITSCEILFALCHIFPLSHVCSAKPGAKPDSIDITVAGMVYGVVHRMALPYVFLYRL